MIMISRFFSLGLAGCFAAMSISLAVADTADAKPARQAEAPSAELKKCPDLSTEENTNLGIVTQILNDKKPYAALAFIESFNFASPRLELIKAHSMRQIGSYAEAEAIYLKLTTTCVAGFAYQGLGQVSNFQGRHQLSADYMQTAARIMPIDSAVRGDYGFALMQLGQYEKAFKEYVTAIELDGRNVRAKNNLIYLLYLTNDINKAEHFAKRYGIEAEELEEIRRNAMAKTPEAS
jgi:Flp pilus assembly protein TadD